MLSCIFFSVCITQSDLGIVINCYNYFCTGVSQVITNPPQNATVIEGEDTTFTCTAEENGMALTIPYGWRFTPSGSSSVVTLNTGTTLTGIETVTVSGGLRTTLTFGGVRREANGGTVTCLAVGTLVVDSDPAILNVQCEYDHRLSKLRDRGVTVSLIAVFSEMLPGNRIGFDHISCRFVPRDSFSST